MYTYDFGDNWVHHITVDKVLLDYDKNHALCLDGAGEAPPEDVGGEGGFTEYMKVKNDPNHPEHNEMRQWAGTQWDAKFGMEKLNKDLCWRCKW